MKCFIMKIYSLGARDTFLTKFFTKFFSLNLNQISDAHWISGAQLHQSGPVYPPMTHEIAPLGG